MGSAAGEGIHLPTRRRRFPTVHWSLFVLCNHRVPAHFTPPPPCIEYGIKGNLKGWQMPAVVMVTVRT